MCLPVRTIPFKELTKMRLNPLSLSRMLLALTAVAWGTISWHHAGAKPAAEEGWISLFNGKDLEGWSPKIRYHDFNDNFANTFRVENGVIKVGYEGYKKFDETFGHLFYKTKFSNYRLRLEYRFVGDQCPGGPGWAFKNSGLMIHCEDPAKMRKDQDFPVSIEVQYLGGPERGTRSTGNLCTPGTHVVMDGKLIKQHCIESTSDTFRGDQWVTAEVEVHGNGKIKHIINGKTVIEYEKAQLDDSSPDGRRLIMDRNGDVMLKEGYISLQSESHPIEFRKIEVLPLME